MTLQIHSSKTTHGRSVWKCDVCGRVDLWNDDWHFFGSVLFEDSMPAEEYPTLCSENCRKAFDAGLKNGSIEVPRVKPHGYSVRVIGKRRGY